MTLLTWLFTGSFCGLLAALFLRRGEERKYRLNMFVGIVGSILAGLIFAPMFGIEIINQKDFSFPSMLVGFAGAIILLAAVYFYQLRSVKTA